MKRGVIFAGGKCSLPVNLSEILDGADFIACADSGYDLAVKNGIVPDIIIGDMDSVQRKLPEGVRFIKLKCEKDDTDTEACIDFLINEGCDEIVLLGGLVGRCDHELANIMLTVYAAKRGAKLVIKSADTEIFAIEVQAKVFGEVGDLLSLLPVCGDAEGVSLSGLKYKLSGETLKIGKTVGISNEFICEKAEIKIEKGLVIAVKTKR